MDTQSRIERPTLDDDAFADAARDQPRPAAAPRGLRSVFRALEGALSGRFGRKEAAPVAELPPDPVLDPAPAVEREPEPAPQASAVEPLPATNAPVPPRPTRLQITEETAVYKEVDGRTLRMMIVRPAGADPASGRPTVLFFHGGGWRRGTARQFLPYCTLLAERGIVGATAEYRLIEGEADQVPHDAVADARSALQWLQAHAADYGCDPARIGAGGGSSGAHLALMTAMVPAPGARPPAALLLMNPPCNFDGYASTVPIEERRRLSPHHLVDATLPPTLILHGTADKVIPYRQIADFQAQATRVGVRHLAIVPFEGRGHGFFNRGSGEPGDFRRTAQALGAFLRELRWL